MLQWYALYWSGQLGYVHRGAHTSSPTFQLSSESTAASQFTDRKSARKALRVARKAALSARSKASAARQDEHEPHSSASTNAAQSVDAKTFADDAQTTSSTEVCANYSAIPHFPEHLDGSAAREEFYVYDRDEDKSSATVSMAHTLYERTGEVLDDTVCAYIAVMLPLYVNLSSYLPTQQAMWIVRNVSTEVHGNESRNVVKIIEVKSGYEASIHR